MSATRVGSAHPPGEKRVQKVVFRGSWPIWSITRLGLRHHQASPGKVAFSVSDGPNLFLPRGHSWQRFERFMHLILPLWQDEQVAELEREKVPHRGHVEKCTEVVGYAMARRRRGTTKHVEASPIFFPKLGTKKNNGVHVFGNAI